MSNRQSYMSMVSAMLSLSDTAQKRRDLLVGFCTQLDRAGKKARKLRRRKQMELRGEKDDEDEEDESPKEIRVPQAMQQLSHLMQQVHLDPSGCVCTVLESFGCVRVIADDVCRRMRLGQKVDELAAATKEFHETIWKITASLILMKPANNEKLIFHLTRAPLKLFSADTMKVR